MKVSKEEISIAIFPAIIASLCCLAPVVLVLFGLSTISFAAYLTDLLDVQYRWLFILFGIISLIFSLIFYFRKKGICTLDQAKKQKNEIINTSLIVIIASIIIYGILFYGILNYLGKFLGIWS